jgi:hypothetical protein
LLGLSIIVSGGRLPGKPASRRITTSVYTTIRGYTPILIIIDEASRVPDDLYRAVRPMLAVSHGQIVAISTPFGQRGWFFNEWESDRKWKRVKITNGMPSPIRGMREEVMCQPTPGQVRLFQGSGRSPPC